MSHQQSVACVACLTPDLDNQIMGGIKRDNRGYVNVHWIDGNMKFLRD